MNLKLQTTNYKQLTFLTLFFALTFLFGVAKSQIIFSGNEQIGVDEKLSDTIPFNIKFINENDDTITLGTLIDKPTVFSFVYFDCPGLCSPLQKGISELVDNSDLELGKDYQIITISFNYKDNPEKAKQKKKNFAINISKEKSKYWYYLTGDSTSISDILTATGYKIKVTGLDFAHPSAIIIVSPKGKITRYLYGLTFLPFDFKMAVIESQQGLARPSISRVLEFCFAYDPEGKKYTLEVTKISATIIIFFALVLFIFLIISSRRRRKNKNINNKHTKE